MKRDNLIVLLAYRVGRLIGWCAAAFLLASAFGLVIGLIWLAVMPVAAVVGIAWEWVLHWTAGLRP